MRIRGLRVLTVSFLFSVGVSLSLFASTIGPPPEGTPVLETRAESSNFSGLLDVTASYEYFFQSPALWAQELIGADLTRDLLKDLEVKPVIVVVSDSGVAVGSSRVVDYVSGDSESYELRPLSANRTLGYSLAQAFKEKDSLAQSLLRGEEAPKTIRAFASIFGSIEHGSHVAGLVGAENQSFGASHLATIEDLNVFRGNEKLNPTRLLAGLKALRDRPDPTGVLNMSHGLSVNPEVLSVLEGLVESHDSLCVVAAMNGGRPLSEDSLTSKAEKCMVVGSLSKLGLKDADSNYGPRISLVAPGQDLISYGSLFEWNHQSVTVLSGTSMSAPLVSGAAATLRAILPHAKARQIRRLLEMTAVDLGAPGRDEINGFGLLNLYRAATVALRLRDREDLDEALEDKATFDLSSISSEAWHEAQSLEKGSREWAKAVRKAVLLQGDPSPFYELGEAYASLGFRSYGDGLKILSRNSRAAEISSEELHSFSRILAKEQNEVSHRDLLNRSVLGAIDQPDLLLAVFSFLDELPRSIFYEHTRRRLFGIRPGYLWRLEEISRRKSLDFQGLLPLGSHEVAKFIYPSLMNP